MAETIGGAGSRARLEADTENEEHNRRLTHLSGQLLEDDDREIAFEGTNVTGIVEPREGNTDGDRRWKHSADGISLAWSSTVSADTKEAFDDNRNWMMLEFPEQQEILEYIQRTYLDLQEQFATYATGQNRNWGVRATSRTEGSHGKVKAFLPNRNSNLRDTQ